MGQNNTSKQEVGHCDKTTLQIFFIFTILNTYVPLIFHAKIQPKLVIKVVICGKYKNLNTFTKI